jgi:hypothetical protein
VPCAPDTKISQEHEASALQTEKRVAVVEFRDNIIEWLLEEENPSIRYRTLTELLDRSVTDIQVVETKAQIAKSEPVQFIFSKMHPEGYWLYNGKGDAVEYEHWYTTHFNLGILAELALDQNDPKISLAVNRYLGLQKEDGDFLRHYSCLYAYNLRTFILMGFRHDPRVQKTIDLLLATDRHDGGYLCEWLPHFTEHTKSCIRGSMKALTAFSVLPEYWGTKRCKKLVEYFLKRRIYFRMSQPNRIIGDDITDYPFVLTKTTFPIFFMASFLEALWALSIMGYGEREELNEAWQLLETKKDTDGKYVLEDAPPFTYYRGGGGQEGVANKWITFYAYLALKHRKKFAGLVP